LCRSEFRLDLTIKAENVRRIYSHRCSAEQLPTRLHQIGSSCSSFVVRVIAHRQHPQRNKTGYDDNLVEG
jgi:hypothetical protein